MAHLLEVSTCPPTPKIWSIAIAFNTSIFKQAVNIIQVADQVAGETIPIRLFLGGFDLTPTFRDVNKKYSTRYYLSLVLIDEGALRNIIMPPIRGDHNLDWPMTGIPWSPWNLWAG